MNKKRAKYIIAPFVALLGMGFFINTFNEDKETSFSENRALQQRPTMESLKNGTFTKEYDKYYSDQFAFREEIMSFYDKIKVAFGSDKIKDYYVLDDNWIMPTPTKTLSDKDIKEASDKIRDLSSKDYSKDKEFYYVSTPHKETSVSHLYPKSVRNLSKAVENRDRFEKDLADTDIKFINIDKYFMNDFSKEDRERLYFKTDHHWNGTGAYEGFKYMMNQMGFGSYIKDEDYKKSTLNKGTFLGSYNKNLNKLVNEKEDIDYIHKKNPSNYKYYKFDGNKEVEVKEEDVVATRRNESDILYGGAYMFGNACNILKIKNDDAPIDKKVIVFRDSYQAPTSWLFADMFKEVELVDVRYTENLPLNAEDMIEKSDSDIVMFMYNDADFNEMIAQIK